MNGEYVPTSKVRRPAGQFIDLNRADVSSVPPEYPTIIFLNHWPVGLFCDLADPPDELRLPFVGPIQFETQVMRGVTEFRTARRFGRVSALDALLRARSISGMP